MNLRQISLAVVLTGVSGAAAMAQTPQERLADPKTAPSTLESPRAEAYYNFTMGHIYEQQYEATSSAEYATKAIEAYKKAYALDPKSQIIGERLAEMYWKAQRIHDAVAEAQEILKRDPDNLQSRRLLGRIYLRSLGDVSASNGQSETVSKAIEQYREINRLDPSDTESALAGASGSFGRCAHASARSGESGEGLPQSGGTRSFGVEPPTRAGADTVGRRKISRSAQSIRKAFGCHARRFGRVSANRSDLPPAPPAR